MSSDEVTIRSRRLVETIARMTLYATNTPGSVDDHLDAMVTLNMLIEGAREIVALGKQDAPKITRSETDCISGEVCFDVRCDLEGKCREDRS